MHDSEKQMRSSVACTLLSLREFNFSRLKYLLNVMACVVLWSSLFMNWYLNHLP